MELRAGSGGARLERPGAEPKQGKRNWSSDEPAVAGARLERPGAEPKHAESKARVEAVAQGGSCAPSRVPRRSSKPAVPGARLEGRGAGPGPAGGTVFLHLFFGRLYLCVNYAPSCIYWPKYHTIAFFNRATSATLVLIGLTGLFTGMVRQWDHHHAPCDFGVER